MADSTRRTRSVETTPPDGFTLIEILLVVVMIGVVTAAIAATVTVTLRHTPPTEVRADDARSMKGLVTWLPQDVDATPPDGFNRDPAYWPCGGAPTSTASHNVLTVEWEERGAAVTLYAASYRYEQSGTGWALRRYVCDDAGGGSMGAAVAINLTSALPAWDDANPPARVVLCSGSIGTDGACPSAAIIPDSITEPDPDVNGYVVRSLKLLIDRADGTSITIDAAPKNPDQDLADDPGAATNEAPMRLEAENQVIQMFAGQTVMIDLAATHGLHDPDGDPISVALDSTEPVPTGLAVATSDPLNVEVTTDPALPDGIVSDTVTDRIVLIVSDNRAGWTDVTLQVEILPEPNITPTLTTTTYHLTLDQHSSVVLPLDVVMGVSDANGDDVTVRVLERPSVPLSGDPVPGSPDLLDLRVDASGAAPGSYPIPITLEFDDGEGGTVIGYVYISLTAPTVNHPPVATTSAMAFDMEAGDSISLPLDTSHGVHDPDGDAISIVEMIAPAGVTTTVSGLDVTIETAAGLAVGPMPSPIEFRIADVHGEELVVTVLLTIIPTPEPPSDCILQSLVVAPGAVARHALGGQPHLLAEDVTITATYTGSCDGLALNYDTGDTSGLGTNRVFPIGSPASIVVLGKDSGGTEKWTPGFHTITLSTTSNVTPNTLSVDLEVI